jgi:dihydrofolate synthase/folylpolyglutamate synthase
MPSRSLSEWLLWQESLNPAEIELGLDRVRGVADKLSLTPPVGAVFVVAGTNGKGSCAAAIEALVRTTGATVGVYSSPHLVRYNERICVDGVAASDAELVAAFEKIELAREEIPLTFFEFGTLAALQIFAARNCAAWVLEVGLGGRLDAVNIVDASYSVITTVDIDHQEWLGDTVEQIAAEKAGVIRSRTPVFYGDKPVPESVREAAEKHEAPFYRLDESYRYEIREDSWDWFGAAVELRHLPLPPGAGADQVRNVSLALAVIEQYDTAILTGTEDLRNLLASTRLPGRFQIVNREHEWVLDVAHNRQAAAALKAKMLHLGSLAGGSTTIVVGMLGDKQAQPFVRELADIADRWVTCTTGGNRGASDESLAMTINELNGVEASAGGTVAQALELARKRTPHGGRILVCGSFMVVGPALEWLGLY